MDRWEGTPPRVVSWTLRVFVAAKNPKTNNTLNEAGCNIDPLCPPYVPPPPPPPSDWLLTLSDFCLDHFEWVFVQRGHLPSKLARQRTPNWADFGALAGSPIG